MIDAATIQMLDTLATRLHRAKVFAAEVATADMAFAILLAGHELGFTPMASARSVALVKSKVSLSADATIALCVRERTVCQYFRLSESTATRATYETHRVGAPKPVSLSYTIDDARSAGLLGSGTWQKHPAAMLRARCGAALARSTYPDLVAGIYDPDEADEIRGHAAEPARHASERPAPLPPPAAVPSLASVGVEAPAAPAPMAFATPGLSASELAAMLAMLDGAATTEALDAVRAEMRPDVSTRATPDQRRTLRERAEARRAALSQPTPTDDPPKGTRRPRKATVADAAGDGASSEPAPAAEALASRERVASVGGVRAYLSAKGSAREVERATRAHGRHVAGFCDAAVERLEALTPADADGARVTEATLRRRVETWAAEGPVAQIARAA